MRKLFLIPLLALVLAGCNAGTTAQRASQVIGAILNIAQAEEAALPPSDSAVLTPWVTLGQTLEGQLDTCISSAIGTGSKKAAFLSCFNTFEAGLFSTQELAQLRLLSPSTQSKVELWATAISVGLNVAVDALGGAPVTPPAIGPAPTSAELHALAHQVGY